MPLLCLRGPLLSWYSAGVHLISSFGSHLLSRPTMKEVCFHRPLSGEKENSRLAVQLEVSSIWGCFVPELAGGFLEAHTIKMM